MSGVGCLFVFAQLERVHLHTVIIFSVSCAVRGPPEQPCLLPCTSILRISQLETIHMIVQLYLHLLVMLLCGVCIQNYRIVFCEIGAVSDVILT